MISYKSWLECVRKRSRTRSAPAADNSSRRVFFARAGCSSTSVSQTDDRRSAHGDVVLPARSAAQGSRRLPEYRCQRTGSMSFVVSLALHGHTDQVPLHLQLLSSLAERWQSLPFRFVRWTRANRRTTGSGNHNRLSFFRAVEETLKTALCLLNRSLCHSLVLKIWQLLVTNNERFVPPSSASRFDAQMYRS